MDLSYTYFKPHNPPRVLRRDGQGSLDELTPTGWRRWPWFKSVGGSLGQPWDVFDIARRCRQRMNSVKLDAEVMDSRQRQAWREWVRPPLADGAPTSFTHEQHQEARRAYEEEFPADLTAPGLLGELIDEAKDGLQRQLDRVRSIEQRASLYQGGAAVTGGLVLTGSGLLAGDGALDAASLRWLALVGGLALSVCLVVSGLRARQACVSIFDWSRPTTRWQLRERATSKDVNEARRHLLAALLLGQDREQLIGDWKLSRLKQASGYFAGAVLASVFVSMLFVADVLF